MLQLIFCNVISTIVTGVQTDGHLVVNRVVKLIWKKSTDKHVGHTVLLHQKSYKYKLVMCHCLHSINVG